MTPNGGGPAAPTCGTGWVEAHPPAPFHFITGGVEQAVAQAQTLAGDRVVAVTAGTSARQCLELGPLDEVAVDLVPVVMGKLLWDPDARVLIAANLVGDWLPPDWSGRSKPAG